MEESQAALAVARGTSAVTSRTEDKDNHGGRREQAKAVRHRSSKASRTQTILTATAAIAKSTDTNARCVVSGFARKERSDRSVS